MERKRGTFPMRCWCLLLLPALLLMARLGYAAPAPPPAAVPLAFSELFDATPRELVPSKKLLSLNGKRVRIVGFMAHLDMAHENPGGGAAVAAPNSFFLCHLPTQVA